MELIVTILATVAGTTAANLLTELIITKARMSRKKEGKHIKRD